MVKVGRYELHLGENKLSEKEVVALFMETFPLAIEADVKKAAKSYVNKSRNTPKQNPTSGEELSKLDKGGAGESELKEAEPRKSSKR